MSNRTNFKEVAANLRTKDMAIRRISEDNPHGGYISGYLVGDNVLLFPIRWQRLDDIWENCCLDGRLSDGMTRR